MEKEDLLKKFKDAEYYVQVNLIEFWMKKEGLKFEIYNEDYKLLKRVKEWRVAYDLAFNKRKIGSIEIPEIKFSKSSGSLVFETQVDVFEKLLEKIELQVEEIYNISKHKIAKYL